MLQYKAEWNGVNLIRIGRFEPSSKMCSCGHINKDLKLSDRKWICPCCGSEMIEICLQHKTLKIWLRKQNLLSQENISPVVNRAEDAELPTLVGTVKRQIISV